MYGGDDNRIIVYNMERWLMEREGGVEKKSLERKTLENNPPNIGNYVHQ